MAADAMMIHPTVGMLADLAGLIAPWVTSGSRLIATLPARPRPIIQPKMRRRSS